MLIRLLPLLRRSSRNRRYPGLLLHSRRLLPLASSILYSLGNFAEAAFEELSRLEVVAEVVDSEVVSLVAGWVGETMAAGWVGETMAVKLVV